MNKFNFDQGDDLGDFLGQPSEGPRELPQAPEYVRIRAEVPVFEERCKKCDGSGQFRSYAGRSLGQCFACKGSGKFTFKTPPEQRAAARARAEAGKEAVRADHKAEIDWLVAKVAQPRLPEGYANLLRDLLGKLNNGQELTEGQLGVIRKGQARDAEYAAKRVERAQERVQTAPAVDASKILEAVQKAKIQGHNEIFLRFQGMVICEAKKHPGTLYVKSGKQYDETYYGKIVDGRFVASRDCSPEMAAQIIAIASDPANAAKVYGHTSGQCSCCGRRLDNPESVARGIGPICAQRFGW